MDGLATGESRQTGDFIIDWGKIVRIFGLKIRNSWPISDNERAATRDFQAEFSSDMNNWDLAVSGTLSDTTVMANCQDVPLESFQVTNSPIEARFMKFKILSAYETTYGLNYIGLDYEIIR